MTREQRELTALYIKAEVARFLTQNQDRIASEIEAKYGFHPELEHNKDKQHESNAPTSQRPPIASRTPDQHGNAEDDIPSF